MTTDPKSTTETMHAQGRALRSLARSILGTTEGADDVVQEAYSAALTKMPKAGNPAGWLTRVVQNLARRRRRDTARRRRHLAAAAAPGPVTAPAVDDILADVETHRQLADAVLALGEPCRTALVLRYWHDLPPRKIARRLGIPVATVKTRLQRGLAELRTRLDRRHGDRRSWLLTLVPIARPDAMLGLSTGTASAAATAAATLAIMKGKHVLLACAALAGAALTAWTFWPTPVPLDGPRPAEAPPQQQAGTVIAPAPRPGPSGGGAEPANVTRDPAGAEPGAATPAGETCTVVGRVVAAGSDAPIRDARLRLVNFWHSERYPDAATGVDGDGRFEVQVPLPGTWIPFTFALADAPGWATRELRLGQDVQQSIADGRLDLGTLRLERGVAVTGRVLDRDGAPLSTRARLLAWDPARRGSWASMYGGRTVGFTAERGEIALDERLSPPKGAALMLAAVCGRGVGWTRLEIAAGQTWLAPVEIRLQPGGGVDVRVVDESGEPVAGADVQAVPYFEPIGLSPMWEPARAWQTTPNLGEVRDLFHRTTDAGGRAVFTNLPLRVGEAVRDANRHQRRVDAAILAAAAEGYITGGTTADPADGDIVPVEIVLQRRRHVAFHGRVTTADGAAVPGATVKLNGEELSCVSDTAGRYELGEHTYQSGSAYLLVEGADVPLTHVVVEIPGAGARIEHDIVVERRDPVHGRVVDQFGEPVAGATIMLGVENGAHYNSVPEQTGADGTFVFPDATASHDDLWIAPPEPKAAWRVAAGRKLGTRDGEVITLHRLGVGLVDLLVHVVDAGGAPASPSEALLLPLHGTSWNTDAALPRTELALGRVTAAAVAPGRYRLVLRAAGGLRADRVVTVPSGAAVHEERVEVGAPATVICTLDASAMSAGELAKWQQFLVLLDDPRGDSFAVDAAGDRLPYTPNTAGFRPGVRETFELRRVTPDTLLRLRVPHAGLFGEVWFRARAGAETRVTLRVETAGVLAFAVPEDAPAGAVEVDVRTADGEWRTVQTADVDAGGDRRPITVERPAGEVDWRLRLWPTGGGEMIERIGKTDVEAGRTRTVSW